MKRLADIPACAGRALGDCLICRRRLPAALPGAARQLEPTFDAGKCLDFLPVPRVPAEFAALAPADTERPWVRVRELSRGGY